MATVSGQSPIVHTPDFEWVMPSARSGWYLIGPFSSMHFEKPSQMEFITIRQWAQSILDYGRNEKRPLLPIPRFTLWERIKLAHRMLTGPSARVLLIARKPAAGDSITVDGMRAEFYPQEAVAGTPGAGGGVS